MHNGEIPQYTKASREWLIMQGERGLALFQNIGIGFPWQTARPKLIEHKIILTWDKEIGPVEFPVFKLDSGRYFIWKNLRDGAEGWSLGTIYLNMRKKKLRITISYDRPEKEAAIDFVNRSVVRFEDNAETFLRVSGPGRYDRDAMGIGGALIEIDKLKALSNRYYNALKACGSNDKAAKSIKRKMGNVTHRRTGVVQSWNHTWSKRITQRTLGWGCGILILDNVPSVELFGRPWQINQLKDHLKYKFEEHGGKFFCNDEKLQRKVKTIKNKDHRKVLQLCLIELESYNKAGKVMNITPAKVAKLFKTAITEEFK